MKNIIFCILSLILVQVSFAQKKTPFRGKYEQFLEQGEKEEETQYHTMLSKKQDGSYVFRQFFPETNQITYYITYTKNKKTRNGLYQEWYDDGTLVKKGNYVDDLKQDEWYEKGIGSGMYKDDKKEGEWQLKDKDGRLKSVYNYVNGRKEGVFMTYDSLGLVSNEGFYKMDTIFSQSKEKPKELRITPMMLSCVEEDIADRKKCSDIQLLTYIYKDIRYPSIARENDIEGTTITQFSIEKDGSISDINVLRGLCQDIKLEVIRVINNLPKWNPGMVDDKKVKVLYTLPIKFKLEG
jgi:hypothetical protein